MRKYQTKVKSLGDEGVERKCIRFELNNQENRKQVQQGSYKDKKPNLAPHAKPTIQMYKEYNLTTYLSMKEGPSKLQNKKEL